MDQTDYWKHDTGKHPYIIQTDRLMIHGHISKLFQTWFLKIDWVERNEKCGTAKQTEFTKRPGENTIQTKTYNFQVDQRITHEATEAEAQGPAVFQRVALHKIAHRIVPALMRCSLQVCFWSISGWCVHRLPTPTFVSSPDSSWHSSLSMNGLAKPPEDGSFVGARCKPALM